MIDLNSPELQSAFKKIQRTSFITNIIMCVITVVSFAVAIWAVSRTPQDDPTWAEIFFFVLLAIIIGYLVFMVVWDVKVRSVNRLVLRKYVAENFYGAESLLSGGETAVFEVVIAGDKLAVLREGKGDTALFDLTPVKAYTGVCASILRYVKAFVYDYYFSKLASGEKIDSVVLRDNVGKQTRTYTYIADGQPVKDRSKSFNFKHGIIRA